jgi:lysozyme family protein
MTKEFLEGMKFIFEHENVLSKGKVVAEHDPRDLGGTTKYGIDARSHPNVDIENLTKQQALEIYWDEWLDCHADKFPWPLSLAYFDAVVNTGKRQAVLLLQRVVGTVDDGIIGPKTIAVANKECERQTAQLVALKLCNKKKDFYITLCKDHPEKNCYKEGWLNRVADLTKTIDPTV